MVNIKLERIARYPLTLKFNGELEFNQFLSENLEILNDKIPNIDFTGIDVKTEEYIGEFRVDISGHNLVIESQFGDSDHDHLGKILVYFANKEVDSVIWICEAARAEHIKAVQWLNERSEEDENFYLLEAKIINVGSTFAIDFDLIVSPEEFRELGRLHKQKEGRKWINFLKGIKEEFSYDLNKLTIGRVAKSFIKINTDYDKEVHYEWHIWNNDEDDLDYIDVALHFEYKKIDKEKNEKLSSEIYKKKDEIEGKIGSELIFSDVYSDWYQIYISKKMEYDNLDDVKKWAIEKMKLFIDAVNPVLNNAMKILG